MASSSAQPPEAAPISEVSQLRTRIEAALDRRGRHYASYFAFAFRFEKDDTGAERDTANFQMILKALGLPAAAEMIIPSDDMTPTWTLIGWLAELIESWRLKKGRALIMGHYAGHGGIDKHDRLGFSACPQYPARVDFLNTFGSFFTEFDLPPDTDTCLILDACYSEVATRWTESPAFTAEVIAAVGPQQKSLENWSYFTRTVDRTFTSRLADEVAREVEKGATGISLGDIISTLRQYASPDRMPVYQLKAGLYGIRIPNLKNVPFPPHQRTISQHQRRQAMISAPDSSSAVPPPITSPSQQGTLHPSTVFPSDLSAVFQVHLNATDPTGADAQNFLDWLLSLGDGVGVGIELMAVYKTITSTSTTLLFQGPWVLWAHLDGLPGFQLVCEPTGGNLLGTLMSSRIR